MASETWSARLSENEVSQARADGAARGLSGSTEIIKAALTALHRETRLDAAVAQVDAFYEGRRAPLPLGVRRSSRRPSGVAEASDRGTLDAPPVSSA